MMLEESSRFHPPFEAGKIPVFYLPDLPIIYAVTPTYDRPTQVFPALQSHKPIVVNFQLILYQITVQKTI